MYHSKSKDGENFGEWVQGRAISRYSVNTDNAEYLKYGEWLHRSRKPKYFKGSRILIQEITGGNPPRISAAQYEGVLYHDPGIISCLNVSNLKTEFLLGLINSKLISWYNLKTSPKGKRTTFPKVLIGDIRKLPIIEASKELQTSITKLVKDISLMALKALKLEIAFVNFLQAELTTEKLSKKLQSWHDLTFGDFIKRINQSHKGRRRYAAEQAARNGMDGHI